MCKSDPKCFNGRPDSFKITGAGFNKNFVPIPAKGHPDICSQPQITVESSRTDRRYAVNGKATEPKLQVQRHAAVKILVITKNPIHTHVKTSG